MDTSSPITFEYTLKRTDYIKFNLLHSFPRWKIVFFLILNTLFSLFIYIELTKDNANFTEAAWLCMFPLFSIILPLIIIVSTRKNYSSDKLAKETQKFTVSDSIIGIESNSGNSSLNWDTVYKLRETKNYFFLYLAKNRAFIINKKALGNENTAAAFKNICQKNIPEKKIKCR